MDWSFKLLLSLSALVLVASSAEIPTEAANQLLPAGPEEDVIRAVQKLAIEEEQRSNPSIFQGTARSKRSTDNDPFGPPSDICEVTQNELTGLSNALQAATTQLSMPANSRSPGGADSSCSKIITYVQNLANYIVTQVKLLKETEIKDTNMFEALKGELSSQLVRFNKIVDDLKSSHNQQVSNLTNTFNTRLAAFQRQVNDLVSANLELQAQNREKSIKLVISQIQSGQASLAFAGLVQLNDYSLLSRIARDAYNRNAENVGKIVAFTALLPWCSHADTVLSLLYTEMGKNSQLGSPQILLMSNAITDHCSKIDQSLANLKSNLSPHVNNVISAWGGRVRSGDTGQVTDFVKQNVAGVLTNNHLSNLVANSYSNSLSNYDNVINFIHALPDYKLRVAGYAKLLSEMKRNGHVYSHETVRFAYKVKETMSLSNYGAQASELRAQYDTLKSAFPSNVVGLIWDGTSCTVKNKQHSEYLYAAGNGYNFNSDSRKVFTWVAGTTVTQGYWDFEPENDAAKFRVRNTQHNEYLMASTHHNKDSERSWVFTWIPGGPIYQRAWRIWPVDSSSFIMENDHNHQYMYADGNMYHGYDWYERRGVFTWRNGVPGGVMLEESKWIISC